MPTYFLSTHAHLCVSGNQVVIMDLRRDKYSAFDIEEASPLSQLVRGWPASNSQAAAKPIAEDAEGIVYLLENRILTADRAFGKLATPLEMQPATEEILMPRSVFADHSKPRYQVRAQHRLAFFFALTRARRLLRNYTIEQVAGRVAIRNADRGTAEQFDWDALRILVSNFRWLRTWGYATKDRCLFNALVLVEYLAAFQVYPRWVFGVRAAPFEAHSWVQADSVLLEDRVAKISQFTPIMAV